MTYGYQHPLEDEKCGDCWTREEGEFCFDDFVWKILCGGFAINVCELVLGTMRRVCEGGGVGEKEHPNRHSLCEV